MAGTAEADGGSEWAEFGPAPESEFCCRPAFGYESEQIKSLKCTTKNKSTATGARNTLAQSTQTFFAGSKRMSAKNTIGERVNLGPAVARQLSAGSNIRRSNVADIGKVANLSNSAPTNSRDNKLLSFRRKSEMECSGVGGL